METSGTRTHTHTSTRTVTYIAITYRDHSLCSGFKAFSKWGSLNSDFIYNVYQNMSVILSTINKKYKCYKKSVKQIN